MNLQIVGKRTEEAATERGGYIQKSERRVRKEMEKGRGREREEKALRANSRKPGSESGDLPLYAHNVETQEILYKVPALVTDKELENLFPLLFLV